MIDKCFMHGKWYYSMEDIERCICKDAGPCQMRLLLPQMDRVDVVDEWISQSSLLDFLTWYGDAAPSGYLYALGQLERAVRGDIKQRRAMSRKHRWEIAWRQGYRCLHCNELLHFKAFDIDHVKELREGGWMKSPTWRRSAATATPRNHDPSRGIEALTVPFSPRVWMRSADAATEY